MSQTISATPKYYNDIQPGRLLQSQVGMRIWDGPNTRGARFDNAVLLAGEVVMVMGCTIVDDKFMRILVLKNGNLLWLSNRIQNLHSNWTIVA